jgi:hypothetical protein
LPDKAPSPDARPSFEDVGQSLSSLNNAIDAFTQRVIRAENRSGDPGAKNPDSTATGNGQFIEETWLRLFRQYFPQEAQNLSRQGILDLRKNADYSYALIQDYARENAAVLQKAGVHVDEAALQLAHFLGASDAAKVLNAASGTPLAGLISQRSIDANPTILGGGRTVDDAIAYANRRASGFDSSSQSRTRTPSDIFQGNMEDIQRRIDLLNAELEAQKGVTTGVNDFGFALEQAKIKQGLLNDAQKAGVEITPELAKSIDELATRYASLEAQQGRNKEAQKNLAEAQKEAADFGRGVLGGIIDDLRAGKDAGEIFADVLSKIADKLEQLALDAIFPTTASGGGGGLGGLLSGLLGLFRAQGGPVRRGQPYIVGEKRAELFVPDQNGTIMPSLPRMTTPSGSQPGGGLIRVQSTVGVVGGSIVPLMTQVSGIVAGQQVKQASKSTPSRLVANQKRGT